MTGSTVRGDGDASGEIPLVVASEINGARASEDDLRALALTNYGHFTAMQAEGGAVRGLDRHLARLDAATQELFGVSLDGERVRGWLRHIVDGRRAACSLRVNVFWRALNRDRMSAASAPDVLITIAPARAVATTPVRLKSFRYERDTPHIKHVGTFGLFHRRRLAQVAGYDDAIFVDASGALSEASIWNVGFVDGDTIVWPDAAILDGVSRQLLHEGLVARGANAETRRVPYGSMRDLRAAFLTNASCAVRPIASIDDVAFEIDPALFARLEAAYAANPPQPI